MELPNPLSHAYLISGGGTDSRAALAQRMAAAYLCQGPGTGKKPCGVCRACRKVSRSVHPDVSRVAPPAGKREIVVEQIRTVRADAYIRPNEGARKVYIINPADAMNATAQNALLKVLEEGPAYAAFLLLAEQPGKLLDTVRSRCEPIALPPEEPAPEPELLERARSLAQVLLTGDELAVNRALVELELQKPKSDWLAALLLEAEHQISSRLARFPQRGSTALRALKLCRDQAAFNPSAGSILALLAVHIFS